jgi:hypothetical protein
MTGGSIAVRLNLSAYISAVTFKTADPPRTHSAARTRPYCMGAAFMSFQ